MRVVILHNAVDADAPPEDQDTLVQVEAVRAALARLGHDSMAVACTLDLAALREELLRQKAEVVFNLVESLGESDSLAYLPLAVLDALSIPYAGNRTESLFLTTHKVLAKQRLRQAGLPTSDWIENGLTIHEGHQVHEDLGSGLADVPSCSSWIIKGLWDQGSRGMDDDAVLHGLGQKELAEHLARRAQRMGRPCFAEGFIEGREFNVALLAAEKRGQAPFVRSTQRAVPAKGACPLFSREPLALPPAEIRFDAFPPGKPRIVGHRAKWQPDSFEYHHTPRRFDFEPADATLLDRLRELARQCWGLFRLRGWARVDFRVDANGQPWILEINANPCLSLDAGFAAALERAGISFDEAIRRILDDSHE
jgi:D-alanine-D-alanine ligase